MINNKRKSFGLLVSFSVISAIFMACHFEKAFSADSQEPFGINNPFDNDTQDLIKLGGLMNDLGITWVSDSLFRSKIEPKKGT